MPPTHSELWTDERVEETVSSAYVHSHLRPNEQELLQRTLYYGGGLTDDTYLDWILTRAKRFFLILVATGVPDQIFGIVDDAYDDEDLPIPEQNVPDLRLSFKPDRSLDKRFYRNQFRFLTRIVGEGEHIRYADDESIPVVPVSLKSVLPLASFSSDKVRLPSEPPRVVLRRKIPIDAKLTEEDILAEIADSRRLCHEHIISVFGSYLYQGTFNVLSTPAAEHSLKTFLADTPKAFNNLTKTQRRQILINWPHCLANALAWLHDNGEFHGAIRPSNIQVDESFHISLGLLDGEGLLRNSVKADDIEAYQFAPPERWKRAVTVQSSISAKSFPSGGRTNVKVGTKERWNHSEGSGSTRSRSRTGSASAYTFQATSRGNYARLRLSAAANTGVPQQMPSFRGRGRVIPADVKSISTQGTVRPTTGASSIAPGRAPSIISSNSSTSKNNKQPPMGSSFFMSGPEARSAVLQTWQSVEQDMFASDVFSLGAVIMDILTVLCKKTISAFARHRAAKNRSAGRGGGLADASFHANLGQVFLWAQSLQNEAEKKAKKDESKVYHAVGPVVQLTLQCLERDPTSRSTSEQLEKKLGEYISKFAEIPRLHCAAEKCTRGSERSASVPLSETSAVGASARKMSSTDRLRQIPSNPRIVTNEWRQHQQHVLPEAEALRSPTSTTTSTRALSVDTNPATTSSTSITSFTLDGLSDTMVGSPQSREPSTRGDRQNRVPPIHEVPWAGDLPDSPEYKTWHKNDSEVDPRLSFGESLDAGAYTFMNFSTSTSSEEGAKYFPRPPTNPPNRELPPLPPLPEKPRQQKSKRHLRAAELQRDHPKEVEDALPPPIRMTRKEGNLASTHRSRHDMTNARDHRRVHRAEHPARMDSLQQMMLDHGLNDDSYDMMRQARRAHISTQQSRSRSRQDYERQVIMRART